LITPRLIPQSLVAGETAEVALRLHNESAVACLSIYVEIELSFGLVLANGTRLIQISRLDPETYWDHKMQLTAGRAGLQHLIFPTFSYRDMAGRAHRADDSKLVLQVSEPRIRPARLPAPSAPKPSLPARPSSVFISHRRSESRWFADLLASRLRDGLKRRDVFLDRDAIEAGEDFRRRIDEELARCAALLALIGPQWKSVEMFHGVRRIEEDDDWVRHEISVALNREILVIPVLYDGSQIPTRAELPADLAELSDRQAVTIGIDSYEQDIRKLVKRLRGMLDRNQ
jgi:hypothetical protein